MFLLVDGLQRHRVRLHTSCLVSEIKHAPLIPHPAAYIPHAKTTVSAGTLKPARAGVERMLPMSGLVRVRRRSGEVVPWQSAQGLVKIGRWAAKDAEVNNGRDSSHAPRMRGIATFGGVGIGDGYLAGAKEV